jgi:hypothetical protein
MLAEGLRDDAGRRYAEQVAAVAAQHGEPWVASFSPAEMFRLLTTHTLVVLEQADQEHAVDTGLWRRADSLAPSMLAMLAHARR